MLRKGSAAVHVSVNRGKQLDEKLLIGTLGVNCIEYTRRTIDTVRTNCKHVEFLYVDNGSTSENLEKINSWNANNDDIDLFLREANGRNAGVSVGWNQIIRHALKNEATKILICNNDIAFGPCTIDGMIESFYRLKKEVPEVVMVTATNHTKNPNDLRNIKQVWNYHEHPDFSCFMIEPKFTDLVGWFDEEYYPAFWEDNYMHWSILLRGYKAFGSDFAPYSHIASRTRYGNPNIVTHQDFRRNKIRFFRKMLTDTPDQEIADARYKAWIDSGGCKHPTVEQVLEFAFKNGMVSKELQEWLEKRTIDNTP